MMLHEHVYENKTIICIVLLHLSMFFFVLPLIFRTLGPDIQPHQDARLFFFTRAKGDAVWTYGSIMSHANLTMAVFYSHP